MTLQDEALEMFEGRRTTERRRFSWRTVAYGHTRSRRRGARRNGDSAAIFVDWHHPWLFFLATGTMLLSTMDAYLTLQLVARGAIEVNPIMAVALQYGSSAFASSKLFLTGFAILTLVYLSRARFLNLLRTGLILTAAFSLYACLVCYQFLLLIHP